MKSYRTLLLILKYILWFFGAEMSKKACVCLSLLFLISISFSAYLNFEGPPIQLTNYGSNGDLVVGDDGRIHVVWHYSNVVYYKRYNPGSGWSNDTSLGTMGNYATIAIDMTGRVHVCASYSTYYLYYKSCMPVGNGNGGWDASPTILGTSIDGFKYYPSIACTPDTHVHIVFYRYRNMTPTGYMLGYYEKIGSTWQSLVALDSSTGTYYHYYPCIAGGKTNNDIYITWYGHRPGDTTYNQVWYLHRIGTTWDTVENVSNANYYQYLPTIDVNFRNGYPYIEWTGGPTYPYRTIVKYRTSSGWSEADTVSEPGSSYYQYYGEIGAMKDGSMHGVWNGMSASSAPNYAIRYNGSDTLGMNWYTPQDIAEGGSQPRIACDTFLNGHVIWGSSGIYYILGQAPKPNDVGVVNILAPTDTVDSGAVVIPKAVVQNFGTIYGILPVIFKIGNFYTDAAIITLPAGTIDTVEFTPWTALQIGTHITKCTTLLATDTNRLNDFVIDSVTVSGQVLDVGVYSISAPTGVIDSGTVVTPACSVYNYGTTTQSYPVRMKISNFYNDTALILSHIPGTYQYIQFETWTAVQVGTHMVSCSTELDGDEQTSNDRRTDSVMVIAPKDVGTIAILSPSGTVDSGVVVTPQAKVKNFGNTIVSFPVIFQIGTFYIDTGYVSNLNPNDSTVVSFSSWQALPRGTHTTKCTTALFGDINPANDFLNGTVTVRVLDVGVYSISAPKGVIDSGTVVTPACSVYNFGTTTESYPVRMKIGDFYDDTAQIISHAPGTYQYIQFSAWTADQVGNHAVSCSTELAADMQDSNDKITGSVTVIVPGMLVDVGVISIVSPTGWVEPGTFVTPACSVYNFGNFTMSYPVRMKIGTFYNQVESVFGHIPGTAQHLTFPTWIATQIGMHWVSCSTELDGDMQTTNDKITGWIMVMQACPSWNKMADVSGAAKPVKDGGCLTAMGDKVYGMIGNNTQDFMVYDINTYTWTKQGEVPFTTTGKGKQKRVKRGACITNDGQYVYIIKGNNTQEFYRYDPSKDGWTELAQPGFTKRIKGGSMAYNGDSLIYLIGGSNRNEWKVYNINSGKWNDANPTTLPADKWKYGSFIVYAEGKIYALRVGGKTNEFYKLDLTSPTPQWLRIQDMPIYDLTGKTKKARRGAAGAYDGNLIFALKGGNTLEFLSYNPKTDSWKILGNVGNPVAVPKKKIKGGGSLTYSAIGKGFFGYIGNNTNEFWYYFPDTAISAKISNNVMAEDLKSIKPFSLQIIPNPANNLIHISYTLPVKTEATLKLYNVIGNLTYQAKCDNGRFNINTEKLTTGIYIVKFEAGDYKTIRKLIITR